MKIKFIEYFLILFINFAITLLFVNTSFKRVSNNIDNERINTDKQINALNENFELMKIHKDTIIIQVPVPEVKIYQTIKPNV